MWSLRIFLFYCLCGITALLKISEVKNEGMYESNNSTGPVLFGNSNEFEVKILVKNKKNNTEYPIELTVDLIKMAEFNLTSRQLRSGWIEISQRDEEDLVLKDGRRIPLGLKPSAIMHFFDVNSPNVSFKINLENFKKMKMKDIINDPTLVPEDYQRRNVSWPLNDSCDFSHLEISVNASGACIYFNNILFGNASVAPIHNREDVHVVTEGLLMVIVNPFTCKATLKEVLRTADYGGFRDFERYLKSVNNGRLIVVASVREGSSFLNQNTRQLLQDLGSSWIFNYLYRDIWAIGFFKKGKVVIEALAPNLGSYNTSGSHVNIHFSFQDLTTLASEDADCSEWPRTPEWDARRVFCLKHAGFGQLCDCQNPLTFAPTNSTNAQTTQIPIIILTQRYRLLYHLLKSLAVQTRVFNDTILVVTDGKVAEITELAFILNLNLIVHKSEGAAGVIRISRTMRFALFNGLKKFPQAKAFIFLEDDVIVSRDFYEYMNQVLPIFEMDDSIYCVNAFNHNSYRHTAKDPRQLYRTHTHPAYGWMMPRRVIEEIVPRWLPVSIKHDWDYFVGSMLVRGERECVIPDVNRSYHWATNGLHLKASWVSERLYLSRTVNNQENVQLQSLEKLRKDNYEVYMENLINNATMLLINQSSDFEILETGSNKLFVLYVRKNSDNDDAGFRLVATELDLWPMDAREHHHHSWLFHYRNNTVIVIGVPLSKYSKFRPAAQNVMIGSEEDLKFEPIRMELFDRAQRPILMHTNGFQIPFLSPSL